MMQVYGSYWWDKGGLHSGLLLPTVLVWWETCLQWNKSQWRACNELAVSRQDLAPRHVFSRKISNIQNNRKGYLQNGKDSYLHKIAVPNRFIRIAPDGKVSFSQRLTVSARCKMHLKKFPLDSQICPLEIGSFGHPQLDVQYKWAQKPLRSIST